MFRDHTPGNLEILITAGFLALTIGGCHAAAAGGGGDGDGDGDTATVRGRITDGEGAQKAGLGGAGTVAAATAVTASAIGPEGDLTLLAEAEISAPGIYRIDVPPDLDNVILHAVDSAGKPVAAAVLETTGSPGGEVTPTPMSEESSVEAGVLIAIASWGASGGEVSFADLRGRIDAATARAVHDAVGDGGDGEAEFLALAEGATAARAIEMDAYAAAGVDTSQAALSDAERAASQALSVALDRGTDAAAAHDEFFQATAEAAGALGADAETRSHAESQASLCFRLIVSGRLGDTHPVTSSVVLAAARQEGRASGEATEAILTAGDASAGVLDDARAAIATLTKALSSATTTGDAALAYTDFAIAVTGDATVRGSVLDEFLGLDVTGVVAVDLAIATVVTAATVFENAVKDAVDDTLAASSMVDPRQVAEAMAARWDDFTSAVDDAVTTSSLAFGDHTDTSAALLIAAEASFRGN